MQTAKLALGTVQFGLPYGARQSGASVPTTEVARILDQAWSRGIDMLDTAPAYGDAERVLREAWPAGARFEVVTKTPRLEDCGGVDEAVASVRASRERLGVAKLAAVLVHHAPDLAGPDGTSLFSALTMLKDEGLVARIGTSVYDPETLDALLDMHRIECVQIPLNVLDQRFVQNGLIERLAHADIEVHVRSVFLQGVLLAEPETWHPRFASVKPLAQALRQHAKTAGVTPAALLLGWPIRCEGVARVVIGVDSLDDLAANIAAFADATTAASTVDYERFACSDLDIVDPRRWVN